MNITKDFTGGNIRLVGGESGEVHLKNEMRASEGDWFYWAFCVSGAAGETVRFVFDEPNRVGYFGAAVSHDLKQWHWSHSRVDGSSFTYTFGPQEDRVYFAHDMLYTPQMLFDFARRVGLEVKTLAESREGRAIPYFTCGQGERHIVLTARHHACEATGSYVLEGLLEALWKDPIENTVVFCVPMMDYDGVCDGDQGKNRSPHDHNRDYDPRVPAIYETTAAVRRYIDENRVAMGFDFHSPWHSGGRNDKVFIVRRKPEIEHRFLRFGEYLRDSITPASLPYDGTGDIPANTEWNKDASPTFAGYILRRPSAELAFTLETCYFGEEGQEFTQGGGRELGRCFAQALRRYLRA